MSAIDRSIAPEPGPPRPYHFPEVTRQTLANGLQVLIAENHNAPLVSLRVLLRAGADHDTKELAGLASLTADLLDEGAGSRNSIELAEEIGLLGAALGTGADWDASYVSVDVLSRNVEPTVAITADVTRRPRFPEDGVERVRSERLTDLIQQRDEAAAIAAKRFSHLIYGEGAYGNSIVGNPESVARITGAHVRDYYRAHYLPNNLSIVVDGDIETTRAIRLVEEQFGDWERGVERERPTVSPREHEVSRIYLIDRPTAVQSEIRIGHIGVPRSSDDSTSIRPRCAFTIRSAM